MDEQNKIVAELIRGLKHERDELRLQTHLAGQDLKGELQKLDDRLNELERRYQPLESAVEETSAEVWDSLKNVGNDIREGFARIRDSI
jgi:hypothetical protein